MQTKKIRFIFVNFIILSIIWLLLSFLMGYRFTPEQTINRLTTNKDDTNIIKEINHGWSITYIIKTKTSFKTVFILKRGLMWKISAINEFINKSLSTDMVNTIGWMSSNYKNKSITVFAVQTKDPKVKYIKAGWGSNIETKELISNKVIVFVWDSNYMTIDFTAKVYDQNNNELYNYGYNPETPYITKAEDLKWYPVEN